MRTAARGSFATLILVSLLVLPAIASAAIVQKWESGPGANYRLLVRAGDLNQDGVYDLITGEIVGGNQRIGIRSGATGALLAQSALSYTLNDLWVGDIDGDDNAEIVLWDGPTGKFSCLSFNGSNTLAVRWSYFPTITNPIDFQFADFDGNRVLYLVFLDEDERHFFVYNAAGTLVSMIEPGGLTGTLASTHMRVDDFDLDERSELLISFEVTNGVRVRDELYMYESGAPVAVEPGLTGSPSIALGSSTPNPTFSLTRVEFSLPTTGPASLRLFDVKGRGVRTLVDGVVLAGRHEATWDGRDANGRKVPAGQYFYRLNAAGQHASQRVVQLP